MSPIMDELPTLFELARERSDSSRLRLASKLSELFLAEDVGLTKREEEMVNELITLLLSTENVSVRHEMVQKFANKNMPRKIALSLANSTNDIAHTVLRSCETLTDDDLITIVNTQSTDHACSVAMRRSINEAVADALVTTGSLRVMQIVAENLGAKLSPKAVSILAETARLVQSLQRPVMQRPELTPDVAAKLYWWIAQDLRRHIVERFCLSPSALDSALGKAIEQKLNEHIFERHDDGAMGKIADWLEERNAITLSLLPRLLRMGHFRLFSISLSRLAILDVSLIDAIINEKGGRMLAVLCRAIGMEKSGLVSIFLLSRAAREHNETVVHPRELTTTMTAYDRLSQETAQDMLRTWRRNPEYLLQRIEAVKIEPVD